MVPSWLVQVPYDKCTSQVLPHKHGYIELYGLIHNVQQAEVAEKILIQKPKKVVVETAVTPMHGSKTGNIFEVDGFEVGAGMELKQMISGTGIYLKNMEKDIISSMEWQQIKHQYYSEFLVYIAAVAVGADLVFGDIPKQTLLQRLYKDTSEKDLDWDFGIQNTRNVVETLYDSMYDISMSQGKVHELMNLQREACIANSLQHATNTINPDQHVIGVVGADHIQGVSQFWGQQEHIDQLFRQEEDEEITDLQGVKLALMMGVLMQRTSAEVVQFGIDLLKDRLSDERELEKYDMAEVIYSSRRMKFAALENKDLLDYHIMGLKGQSLWQTFEPLRQVRPINGGLGYDKNLFEELLQ
eukprot:TRINITY_DN1461_c0_g2_i4.p1 TRINITY_DN1461_c0_g2~~TRINITY_DN1461_c0_g2_i4.p1  ORF type:complete len:356 (-),score=55.92 TRINITY_DN1461_c0_g2_i4:281-1348(-)